MSDSTPRVRMADWVETYLDVGIQSEVENTRRGPRQVLRPLAAWYDQTRRHPRNVSRDDLVRFFLKEAPFAGKIAGSTHNHYRRYLRMFLQWAMEEELLPTSMSLLGAIKPRAVVRRNFTRMTDTQMAEMVNDCPDLRDAALLAANTIHLARSSELKALRLQDIHFDEGFIDWYNVKKNRPMRKRITPQLDRALRAWITAYTGRVVELRDVGDTPMGEWFVFPRRAPGPGLRQVFYPLLPVSDTASLVQRYTRPIVGVKKYDGATHMGRRSGARAMKQNLVKRGIDPAKARAITQATLDHKSPETTDMYTDDSLAQMMAHEALAVDFLPDVTTVTQLRSVDGRDQAV